MIKKIGLVVVSSAIVLAPFLAQADTLTRYLSFGMSGTDVSSAQTFLAQDVTLYPQGLVTGYFGSLTKSAVINFQVRNGIVANSGSLGAGRIGPATMPVMNLQMANGMYGATTAPTIGSVGVSVGRNNANVSWNTNESAKGMVYYSTSPMTLGEHANSVDVSGNVTMTDNEYRGAQSVAIPNLSANTVYYYLIYTTDQQGNVSVTWPATFQTTN